MLKSSANFSCSENQGVVEEMISTARLPFSLLFTSIMITNASATLRTRYKGVRLILKTMKLTILVILRLALILMYHCNLYWLLVRPGGRLCPPSWELLFQPHRHRHRHRHRCCCSCCHCRQSNFLHSNICLLHCQCSRLH